ncbi:MAG: GumC family protein [Desulfurivibrionaceae bacterium]
MLQIPKIDFQPYVDLFWRRKWWVILPLLITLIAGVGYVHVTPKTYQASTLILVEAQRVPNSYVQSTVTESLQSRLQTISQQVNSRTNLEGIIKEFDLYPAGDQEKTRLVRIKEKIMDKILSFVLRGQSAAAGSEKEEGHSMQSRVENVRKKINISIKNGNRAFEIVFDWRDPDIAARVANALASQFIEQNLAVREEMAMGTTSFMTTEAVRLRQKLETKEKDLEKFKSRYMGMLPSQLQTNLDILRQLKDELNNLETRVAQEKQQAVMLRNQMAMNENLFASDKGQESGQETGSGRVVRLQEQLSALKSSYTENHPDVQRLKRRLEDLKQTEREKERDSTAAESGEEETWSASERTIKPQLEQIRRRVARYEENIGELKDQIEFYKNRVEKTSEVELKLNDLQRDYESVRERYKNLVSKKLNAEMAEELEKRQKGEQFRVIDPAVAPATPHTPNVAMLMTVALVLGLGMGGGLAYIREVLDPAFYTPEEVENSLGVDVLVSLPFVDKKEDKNN